MICSFWIKTIFWKYKNTNRQNIKALKNLFVDPLGVPYHTLKYGRFQPKHLVSQTMHAAVSTETSLFKPQRIHLNGFQPLKTHHNGNKTIQKPILQDGSSNRFLGFEPTTLVPYERKLIDFTKLDKNQVFYSCFPI